MIFWLSLTQYSYRCYTNHALDQFLESLLDFGIENLIRIGGRSKSSRLEEKNLRIVGRTSANVGLEKYQIGQAYSRLEQIAEDGKDACNIFSGNVRSWNSVQRVLALHYTEVFHQFNDRYDAEGFEQQGSVVDRFRAWSSGKTPTQFSPRAGDQSIDAILSRPSIWQTTANERTMLIDHWVSLATESTVETLKDLVEGHRAASSELDAAHQEANRRLISTADVIGITTTGLAKNIKLLRKLNAKVVICEEAGEVLEGHLLNAILPSCQHLIQIGDHEQLRPQISQTLDLSMENDRGKQYRLDESMFERLVREDNCLSVAQLDVQRRMRPEISELIRQTIYPGLRDHPSVSTYPNVVGMNRNVYWLDHRHEEASPEEGTKSKSNDWEVKMVCSFVRHLVRQGIYGSEEIAVLTPYTGQLQKLRRHLGGTFEVVVSDRDQEALERDGLHFDPVALQGELKAAKKVGLDKLIRVATVYVNSLICVLPL